MLVAALLHCCVDMHASGALAPVIMLLSHGARACRLLQAVHKLLARPTWGRLELKEHPQPLKVYNLNLNKMKCN